MCNRIVYQVYVEDHYEDIMCGDSYAKELVYHEECVIMEKQE